MPCADLQMMNARARGDNIDDSVNRSHLVKMDLLNIAIMDSRFSCA